MRSEQEYFVLRSHTAPNSECDRTSHPLIIIPHFLTSSLPKIISRYAITNVKTSITFISTNWNLASTPYTNEGVLRTIKISENSVFNIEINVNKRVFNQEKLCF